MLGEKWPMLMTFFLTMTAAITGKGKKGEGQTPIFNHGKEREGPKNTDY